jgi:prepilin-type N-terminal cleavage/methylation domain-containing protein
VKTRAFSLVEVIVSISLLAVLAVAAGTLASNREGARERTAALAGVPSAMDALTAALDEDSPAALAAEIASSGRAFLWRDAGREGAPWCMAFAGDLPDVVDPVGPLFVAELSHSRLRADGRAVEFTVALGWLVSAPDESRAALLARAPKAAELCRYPGMVVHQ